MTKKFTVIGVKLKDVSQREIEGSDAQHVGTFATYDDAYKSWKENSWAHVDNALMRFFIKNT